MSKQELVLQGLGCASCAAKMEKQINELKDVKNAQVNFATQKLTYESAIEDLEEINIDIKMIVERIEPHVKVFSAHSDKHDHFHDHGHDHEHNEEIDRKEIITLGVGFALFLFGLLTSYSNNIDLFIFAVGYILVGREIIISAVKNLFRGEMLDENFLMTIASLSAFVIGEYPEAVAVMMFYKVGEFFEANAVNKSRKSIEALLDIRPDFANLKQGNKIIKVLPDDVLVDDIIIVKPGEKIPLDGVVVEGESMLDTSVITGESVPRKVSEMDLVYSGSINQSGLLSIKVTKAFAESTVSRILELVEKASTKKAETEKLITKFAKVYTPVVVGIAALLAIIPPLVMSGATFSEWLYRAAIFLVISCPCALVISIPLGFFGGIGAASKKGILIKGGNYLEALNKLEIIVLDKTGTITQGVFKVTEVHAKDGFEETLLKTAAYAEYYSNHPIGKSIQAYSQVEVDESKIKEYQEIAGKGIAVKINGQNVLCGNEKLMTQNEIAINESNTSGTVVHVAKDLTYLGYIVISDRVKADSKKGIERIKKHGIKRVVMLTGDKSAPAIEVGEVVGVDEVYSELLPEDKVTKLEKLQEEKSKKKTIAFVGDGINDAPVLARADIGIAMGGLGSDAAIEAADIVLMTDEISKIGEAIDIAKNTRQIVWQNIIFALGIKIIVMILGAMGIATMWSAVFADVGVAVLAIFNAMRLTNMK